MHVGVRSILCARVVCTLDMFSCFRCGGCGIGGSKDQGMAGEDTQDEHHDPRAQSFYTVASFDERGKSFYGIRERIPSKVDVLRHPSNEWWSDARLDAAHMSEDLGPTPRLLGRTVKLKVLDREEKSACELEYFANPSLVDKKRYIILQLLLGQKIVASLAQVDDVELFDRIFLDDDIETALLGRLKFIVNPANVRIPWSITGPRDASSISDFFGSGNCSIRLKYSLDYICHAVVTIDVYSRFMIRSFLPKLAFQIGRMCDFVLVDYEQRLILTGFRLLSTETLLDLMKTSKTTSPPINKLS